FAKADVLRIVSFDLSSTGTLTTRGSPPQLPKLSKFFPCPSSRHKPPELPHIALMRWMDKTVSIIILNQQMKMLDNKLNAWNCFILKIHDCLHAGRATISQDIFPFAAKGRYSGVQ
ncbi:MAG: hypothetical protein C0200_06365, partial [Thermoproteota archaeon]